MHCARGSVKLRKKNHQLISCTCKARVTNTLAKGTISVAKGGDEVDKRVGGWVGQDTFFRERQVSLEVVLPLDRVTMYRRRPSTTARARAASPPTPTHHTSDHHREATATVMRAAATATTRTCCTLHTQRLLATTIILLPRRHPLARPPARRLRELTHHATPPPLPPCHNAAAAARGGSIARTPTACLVLAAPEEKATPCARNSDANDGRK